MILFANPVQIYLPLKNIIIIIIIRLISYTSIDSINPMMTCD